MLISDIGQELVDEFALFDNNMDKYEYIIELGKDLPALDDGFKTDGYIVKGCQSKVWLNAVLENGTVIYQADSNTVITKGIIALLIRALSGQKPMDIAQHNLDFLGKIGLHGLLSSQRSNGLTAMIKLMKQYAQAFHLKLQTQ